MLLKGIKMKEVGTIHCLHCKAKIGSIYDNGASEILVENELCPHCNSPALFFPIIKWRRKISLLIE